MSEPNELPYSVVRNDEDQYSIWPLSRPAPDGWVKLEMTGTRADCLAYIDRVWTDMRPRTLREHMAGRS